jgi:hypothetical protein
MSRKNHLEAYVSTESINSDVIAACIDAFFPVVVIPIVIVVDKASIHTSGAILDRYEEWKERGITILCTGIDFAFAKNNRPEVSS